MADYRRMVSYMYQYDKGIKKKNVGYARIETRTGECKFTLHMQLLGLLDSIFPTYLIQRKGTEMELIYLGDSLCKNQVVDSKLTALDKNIMNSGYSLSDMGGMLLFLNDEVFYATEWDDKPVILDEVLEALKPKDKEHDRKVANRDIPAVEEEPIEEASVVSESDTDLTEQRSSISAVNNEDSLGVWNPDTKSKVTLKPGEASIKNSFDRSMDPALDFSNIMSDKDIPVYKLPRGWKTIEMLKAKDARQVADAKQVADEKQVEGEKEVANVNPVVEAIKVADADQGIDVEQGADARQGSGRTQVANAKQAAGTNRVIDFKKTIDPNPVSGAKMVQKQPWFVKPPVYRPTQQEELLGEKLLDRKDPKVYEAEKIEKTVQPVAEARAKRLAAIQNEEALRRPVSPRNEMSADMGKEPLLYATNGTVVNNNGMPEVNDTREEEEKPLAAKIFDTYPRIYPFEDNEITLCAKIEPKDIGFLPVDAWVLSNNSFLMHGYYCYNHLIFAKMQDRYGIRYILGVPGIYHNRERFMARMFGFECFKSIRKRELRQGDFGYWYIPIMM